MADVSLTAYLSYPDAPAAIEWLQVIGFEVLALALDTDSDRVAHSELRCGSAVIMVASDDAPYVLAPLVGQSTGAGLYLHVDDVDDVFDRAVAAGATAVIIPEDTAWGGRRARVLDAAGREWSFGTYAPGQAR